MKYNGFLFGHYDSRGGATFIENASKEAAFDQYLRTLGAEDWPEAKELVESDFIGPASIESWRPLESGEDLEYRDDEQKLWANCEAHLLDDLPETIQFQFTQGEQPEGFVESEFGEDACGVIFFAEGVVL